MMRNMRRQMAELLYAAVSLLLTLSFFVPFGAAVSDRIVGALIASFRNRTPFILSASGEKTEQNALTPTQTPTADRERTPDAADAQFIPPEDVLQAQAAFRKTHADQTPSGTVQTQFFTTEGATDFLDDIAVKNGTATKKPDFGALLAQGPSFTPQKDGAPLVLLFHTHTTEAYYPVDDGVMYGDVQTRSEDPSQNVVRVGEEIRSVLEANGVGVIHDTAVYDDVYTGAYARSRITVEKILKKYPSIQIVLDVHRDAIYNSASAACKPTALINGRKAAQVMVITGAEEGSVTDFPRWEENLRFALALQKKAQEVYNGLMRPLYFCPRKYNMDVTPCGLLLEIGSDSNTLEEALYAGHLIGETLSALIKEMSG